MITAFTAGLILAALPGVASDAATSPAATTVCVDEENALLNPQPREAHLAALEALAVCVSSAGDLERGTMIFRTWLSLSPPTDALGSVAVPAAVKALEAARAKVDPAVALVVEKRTVAGRMATILVRVDDPLQLIKRVGWRGASGILTSPVRAAPKLELEVPADIDLELVALDEIGSELHLQPIVRERKAAAAAPVVEAEDPFPWAVVGGVVAGVVVVAAIGAGAAIVLTPPSRVRVHSAVVFDE